MKKLTMLLLPLLTALLAALPSAAAPEPPAPIAILMYHHLVRDGEETNAVSVTESKFRRDMEYLREHQYATLRPEELLEILNGRRSCPKRAVVISFDDGYRSNYTIAYPILKENRCHAVIALLTTHIHSARAREPFFLSWAEVERMAASGWVSFGSHSDDLHNPDNAGLVKTGENAVNGVQRRPGETEEPYRRRVGADLRRSCEKIEAHTGGPVLWFAYPYGAGDGWCESVLNDLEIPLSVLTAPGRVRAGGGTRDLPRCAVREDTDLAALLAGRGN